MLWYSNEIDKKARLLCVNSTNLTNLCGITVAYMIYNMFLYSGHLLNFLLSRRCNETLVSKLETFYSRERQLLYLEAKCSFSFLFFLFLRFNVRLMLGNQLYAPMVHEAP